MVVLFGALLVSCIFPLGLYFYLKTARKEDKEYQKDCWDLLWNGFLLGFPVFGFSLLCFLAFKLLHLGDNWIVKLFFSNFVLKAVSEELMKYLLSSKIIKKNHAKISFLDLMAYTTISAIGFEIMESFTYLFSSNVGQIIVRGVTNMHAAFGLIMGYLMATGYKKNWKHPVLCGLVVPIIIHGVYDLCLSEEIADTDWGLLSLLIAFICLVINIVNYFFMNKARKDPYYTDPLFAEASQLSAIENTESQK
ncbi:MAG: PrsW family intramembrane metalloprotease [Erysipelotrichaceae bacterium]|nr:PrsW family intramembrane metalloprotease [Erysipelotrichaceae bacterium]